MALEAKLVQKLGQSLLMTPQLQQAIKLLQLGRLEYKEALERELLENPILEESKEVEDPALVAPGAQVVATKDEVEQNHADGEIAQATNESAPAWEEYFDNVFSEHQGSATPKGLIDHEDRPSLEATLTHTESLHDHLMSQLRLMDLPEEHEPIIHYLIGNIDKDGYLCASYDEIAEQCHCGPDAVENAVSIIRTLEPAGVGARDLRECLLIQLDDLGLSDSLAAKIISDHLEKLEARRFEQIVKAEGVPLEQVYSAIATIRELEPKPGRPFSDETVRYAIPDIYVTKVGNDYVVSLNEDGLPRLRISPYYIDILKKEAGEGNQNKAYLNDRLKAATFLIRSIHQRQQTIIKVAQSIVKFQRDFLTYGISRMKPLTLKDVAEDIGMHESTVSRVTTAKYMHTPQGVFELKFFFSTGIKTAEGDISSSSIKEKIKKIIDNESPDAPVSDQDIVETLKAENIDIARRTVAKYRESMKILSSSRRKRLF